MSTIETVYLSSTKRGLAQLDPAENTGRMVGPEANC
ncbi:DnaJ -like protein subfamily B member 12 [Giardia duodenalis assemblage B]|uniref:DnaJ-like protein subfamily B member 12 n=1 Tax=Giardia duodenalis assemblage B TaxID=1394984 RepID=A0A132NMD9_GIAIN|nr:DnaJ -like protein subfamily B member 12 [Giardia intestinalis assemblage B]